MDGILILAHGSKRIETEEVMDSLVEKVRKKSGNRLVYPCYLQFSDNNLEKGVERLVGKGASSISVIPLFLFDGVHVTQDIPEEIEGIKAKHPGVEIMLGSHIGADDRLADIVMDRVAALRKGCGG